MKQRIAEYRSQTYSTSAWVSEPSLSVVGASQQTDGSWSDLVYSDTGGGIWDPWVHLMRLEVMAAATRRPGSGYEPGTANHQMMVDKVLLGLDYLLNRSPQPTSTNWYVLAIGRNISLKGIALMMEEDLSQAQKDKILAYLYYYIKPNGNGGYQYYTSTPLVVATGQNRLWLADIHLHGALLKNSATEVAEAISAIKALTAFVTAGEGVHTDYSFMQHGVQFQNGAYGSFFAQEMARNIRLFNGLSYAFNTSQVANIRGYFLEGQNWMIRRGNWDTHVIGRQLAEKNETVLHPLLVNAVQDMKLGDPGFASAYQAMADHIAGTKDDSLVGNKHFYRSDYTSHRRAGYSFHTRMSSVRTGITETGNNENIQNEQLAQGSNSILATGNEYLNIFPCWSWDRIPGTTSPQRASWELKTADWEVPGTQNFVGGVSNGVYGASAKDLNWDGVTGKKSWFYFDEDIVCLGAGITFSGNRDVFTTLNQAVRTSDIYSETATGAGTQVTAAVTQLTDPKWVHQGNVGYFFPVGANVELKNETINGNWYGINQNTYSNPTNETKNRFLLSIKHGSNPVNGSYAYVVLPAQDRLFAQTYSASPQSRILSNTSTLQAVRNDAKKVACAVFWSVPAGQTSQVTLSPELSVSVDKPCMVLVDESGPQIKVSVSCYQASTVNLVLDFVSLPDALMTFALPGSPYSGSSITQTYAPSAENNIALGRPVAFSAQQTGNEAYKAVDGIDNDDNNRWSAETYPDWIEVDLGSNRVFTGTEVHGISNRAYKFRIEAKAAGGSYTTVVDETGNTDPTPLAHTFGTVTARYVRLTVTGAHNYTGGWTSIREFKVLAEASPGGGERSPIADACVRDGVYAGTNFGAAGTLDVKLDMADYSRESYLKFDVAGLENAGSVKVVLTPVFAGAGAATTNFSFELAGTDSWSESVINWNNRPAGGTVLTTSFADFVVGQPVELDVTTAAKAEAAGDGFITLRIRSTTAGSNRNVNFASRENTTVGSRPILEYAP